MNRNVVKTLSKTHSMRKVILFVDFFKRFFDYMYSYTLKIPQKIHSKIARFSNQNEFLKKFIATILLFVALPCKGFSSQEICEEEFSSPPPQRFSIGPEFAHMKRSRAGGTQQHGWLYGVRGTYDRIKRFGFYWGGDLLYAAGPLNGQTASKLPIKSIFTEVDVVGRFGYTLQANIFLQPSLTPFIGWGYFSETNRFRPPSPLELQFETYTSYFAFGFLSSVAPTPYLTVGFNFKGGAMYEARCKVSNDPDPDVDNVRMIVEDRFNYRLELPVTTRFFTCYGYVEGTVVPFYEMRHFGGRENFPFNFLDTKEYLYGLNLQVAYRF